VRVKQALAKFGMAQGKELLVQRPQGDVGEHRIGDERVQRGRQPNDQPDRSRRDLGGHPDSVGSGGSDTVEQFVIRQAVGGAIDCDVLGQRHRQRPARCFGHPPHHPPFGVDVAEVRHELEHAPPRLLQPGGDACEFREPGGERGGRFAGAGAMVEGPRRGEAQGTGFDRLAGQVPHGGDVGGCGRLASRASVSHHVDPQGPVGHLGGEVDVVGQALQRVEVFGKALPVPLQALMQSGARDVLHAFHQGDETFVL
jgi:hypothetical protein